jgi:hypothetical protein
MDGESPRLPSRLYAIAAGAVAAGALLYAVSIFPMKYYIGVCAGRHMATGEMRGPDPLKVQAFYAPIHWMENNTGYFGRKFQRKDQECWRRGFLKGARGGRVRE